MNRSACLFPFLLLAACGGRAVTPAIEVQELSSPQVEEAVIAPAVRVDHAWNGRYALTGEASQDECAGEVVLAAQHLEVNVTEGVTRADVVDRSYPIVSSSADELLAEGRFPTAVCPGGTLYERWTLTKREGGFTGELTSTWPSPRDCGRACTVTFTIRGAQ